MLGENNLHKTLLAGHQREPTVDNRYGVHFEFKDLYSRLLEVQSNQNSFDSQSSHIKATKRSLRFPSLGPLSKPVQKYPESNQIKLKQQNISGKRKLHLTFNEQNTQSSTNIIKKSNSISPIKQRLSLDQSKSVKKLQTKSFQIEKNLVIPKKKRIQSRLKLKF